MRILDRQTGTSLGALRGTRQGRFHGFAAFGPTATTVLTAANNGRIQLWKVPADPAAARFFRQAYPHGFGRDGLRSLQAALASTLAARVVAHAGETIQASTEAVFVPKLWTVDGYEARYFLGPNPAPVFCGAFTPDESVIFTGGADRVIRVWGVPRDRQSLQPLEGVITYVGSQVERGTDTVRVRAELANPRNPARRLRPGTYANLRVYPETSCLASAAGAARGEAAR
jgi:hypothetical protein